MTDKEERANANGAQEAQNDTSESARKMMREAGGMLALHGAMSALSFYYSFFDSEHYAQISDSMKRLRAIITDHWDEIWAIASLPDDIREIAPYIAEELRGLIGERKDAGDYEDKTIPELLAQGYDDQGNPTDGLFAQALERARARAEQDEADQGESIDQTVAELQKLNSIIPTQHVMPNNTLMNELAGMTGKFPINAGAHDLTVIPAKGKQDEITVYVMATCDLEDIAHKEFALTEYERDVSDAFISIWEQAQREKKLPAFTTDSLYRAMPGRGERASAQQKGAITKTIEKLLHLYLDIDATDELRRRGIIADTDKYRIKNFYLQAEEHEYKAGKGKPAKAWVMTSEPLILKYAKMTGQILTVPSRFLAIEKVKKDRNGNAAASGEILPMTEQRQAMTSYMLRRIAVMRHDHDNAKDAYRKYEKNRKKDATLPERPIESFHKQSNIISFDTLFSATGTSANTREMARKNKNFCFNVLDYWKLPGGLICGYEKQTKGQEITGIKILLEPSAKPKKSRAGESQG